MSRPRRSAPAPLSRLSTALSRRDPFWPAQATVLVAILLYLTLPEKLTIGPSWVLPACESALLLVLVALSRPAETGHLTSSRRALSIALTGLVSVVNLVSIGLLAHYLLQGGKAGGHPLLLGGAVLWATNVLLFGVWYWQLDRDGPVARLTAPGPPDFLFVQMSDPEHAPGGWKPGFVDYLYLAYTNATAFSPTDTMPLSPRAKLLMTAQSLSSLVIVGLVVARAVNILS